MIVASHVAAQVTFVFTNQVDGKLVPIESKQRANTQGVETNENQSGRRRKLLQKSILQPKHQYSASQASKKEDSVTSISSKAFQLAGTSSVRTLKATPSITLKPKPSPGTQLPLKRLSPDSVQHDDDFE